MPDTGFKMQSQMSLTPFSTCGGIVIAMYRDCEITTCQVFKASWSPLFYIYRFALAHLVNSCRRKVILEYFKEECNISGYTGAYCFDVCSSPLLVANCQSEMTAVIRAATELSGFGEEKVR